MYLEQKQKSFRQKLKFGEEGEHEVAEILINRGVTVLPLYQFDNNKAPVLFSLNKQIISPDLICFNEDSFMVEVKTKNQWVSYNGRVETGLNQKHFNHYKEIQETTNKEVFVFFNHKTEDPIGFYFCRLNDFTRIWDGTVDGKKVYDEMVFYNIDILKKINFKRSEND